MTLNEEQQEHDFKIHFGNWLLWQEMREQFSFPNMPAWSEQKKKNESEVEEG